MKIFSDFDGVVTDQTTEAGRMLEVFITEMTRISGNAQLVQTWIEQGLMALKNEPHRFGWMSHGRISAFSDEDLFIRNNALAAYFDSRAVSDPELAAFKRVLSSEGVESFDALANWSFNQMARETAEGKIEPLNAPSAKALICLLNAGAEVVVVSNSSTARILTMMERAGVPAVEHGQPANGKVRVRGGAMKFDLGAESREIEFGGLRVDTSRPKYEAIIREERPDAFIGDVFSLDLALPLFLATREPHVFGTPRFFLRTRDYTPSWVKEEFKKKDLSTEGPMLRILKDFADLPPMLGIHDLSQERTTGQNYRSPVGQPLVP